MSRKFDITTGWNSKEMCRHQFSSTSFYDVITASITVHLSSGVKTLYSLKGPLVGSRRKWRGKNYVQDLEYIDKVALVSDSMDTLKKVLKALNDLCVVID